MVSAPVLHDLIGPKPRSSVVALAAPVLILQGLLESQVSDQARLEGALSESSDAAQLYPELLVPLLCIVALLPLEGGTASVIHRLELKVITHNKNTYYTYIYIKKVYI